MHNRTIVKAFEYVRFGEVSIEKGSNPPTFLHFKVKDYDVYRRIDEFGNFNWSCNSLVKEKRKTWGCVMNVNVDRTKAYCSHCLAAEIYLNKIWKKEFEAKNVLP